MRLLIAEDELDLARALMQIFKHDNYSVDTVADGDQALDFIRTGIYDAVILDIMMPKRDGLSVLRQIREEGNNVPVLLLTAKGEVDDRVVGLDSGADDYLTKPFAVKELVARVRAMLRRKTESIESYLEFSNIRLDIQRFTLIGPLDTVRLANKEYQILHMLMSNPTSIISQEKFMDKIWGFDTETDQNVVWVYVSYIRRKLETVGANAIIRSHRNIGYSIEEIES